MVVYCRMGRRAFVPPFGSCGSPPAGQIRRLCLDGTQHLGQHRYGRRIAPADFSDLWDEWPRASRGPRRPAAHAPSPPTRLQKRQIHHPPYCHRRPEKIRQRPRLRSPRVRLRLVRRHLTASLPARSHSQLPCGTDFSLCSSPTVGAKHAAPQMTSPHPHLRRSPRRRPRHPNETLQRPNTLHHQSTKAPPPPTPPPKNPTTKP